MSGELLVAVIVSVVGSNLIVEVFKALREDSKEKKNSVTKDDIKPIQEGIKELLGETLDKKLKHWSKSAVRTKEMWQEIENLYKPYQALKGNGSRKKAYEEAKRITYTE